MPTVWPQPLVRSSRVWSGPALRTSPQHAPLVAQPWAPPAKPNCQQLHDEKGRRPAQTRPGTWEMGGLGPQVIPSGEALILPRLDSKVLSGPPWQRLTDQIVLADAGLQAFATSNPKWVKIMRRYLPRPVQWSSNACNDQKTWHSRSLQDNTQAYVLPYGSIFGSIWIRMPTCIVQVWWTTWPYAGPVLGKLLKAFCNQDQQGKGHLSQLDPKWSGRRPVWVFKILGSAHGSSIWVARKMGYPKKRSVSERGCQRPTNLSRDDDATIWVRCEIHCAGVGFDCKNRFPGRIRECIGSVACWFNMKPNQTQVSVFWVASSYTVLKTNIENPFENPFP